jgi:hypothetical protein
MGDERAEIKSEKTQPHYPFYSNDSVATHHFVALLYGTSKTRTKQLLVPNDYIEAAMCTEAFTKL